MPKQTSPRCSHLASQTLDDEQVVGGLVVARQQRCDVAAAMAVAPKVCPSYGASYSANTGLCLGPHHQKRGNHDQGQPQIIVFFQLFLKEKR